MKRKRKRVPGGGSRYRKATGTRKGMDTWDSQQAYEMERNVSIQSEDKQAELQIQFCK